MSTRTDLAKAMGISVASVSMKIDGKRPSTPEERAILTDALGANAGAAYDPDSVIDALKRENSTLSIENHELRAENNQHRRGTRISWVGVVVIGIVAITIIVCHVGPPWFRLQIERVYANDRLRQENAHLSEKVGWLTEENDILKRTNALYDKAFVDIEEKTGRIGR